MMEEGIISESKPKVGKVESEEEDSDFECYDKSEGNQYMSTSTRKQPGETNQHWHYYRKDRKKTKITRTVRHWMGTVILSYEDKTEN